MGQPVVHFEVIARDGPALRAFYSGDRVIESGRHSVTSLLIDGDEAFVRADDDQLDALGWYTDLAPDGHLEFHDADGRPVADPETQRVLAPVQDPIPPASAGRVEPRPAPRR